MAGWQAIHCVRLLPYFSYPCRKEKDLTEYSKIGYDISNTFPFTSGPLQLSRYSDSLRDGRSGDRIPMGARFSARVQTGRGAHPASCTMGTGSFPGG
jgi:hypothetical protein